MTKAKLCVVIACWRDEIRENMQGSAQTMKYFNWHTVTWAILFGVSVTFSIIICDGHIIYSLDDPYIHLSVAHNILRGFYGINIGEMSSPSSSILWPWLLTIPEVFGVGWFAPLFLNAIAAFATVYIASRFLVRAGWGEPKPSPLLWICLGLVLIFATSTIALPMTGMEHTWHVLTVVIVLEGLVVTAEGGAPSTVFLAGLVAMPLLRFEGAVLSVAALMALFCLGCRRAAVTTSGILVLAVGGWAGLMMHLGLPILPSSVLLKSDVTASVLSGDHVIAALTRNLLFSLSTGRGQLLAASLVALAIITILEKGKPRRRAVYLPVIAAIAAHLVAGHYDWFARYEVYVMALTLLTLLYGAGTLPLAGVRRFAWLRYAVVFAVGIVFDFPYVKAAVLTPLASRNIYEQQYQMRQFAQQYYPTNVGVNDIGLVSYGNDHYVLDLFGLGSERVRRLRMAGVYTSEQMATLADEHAVALVMVYEQWFGFELPPTWHRIAVLHTVDSVTTAQSDVAFYATPRADLAALNAALQAFQASLPARDSLQTSVR